MLKGEYIFYTWWFVKAVRDFRFFFGGTLLAKLSWARSISVQGKRHRINRIWHIYDSALLITCIGKSQSESILHKLELLNFLILMSLFIIPPELQFTVSKSTVPASTLKRSLIQVLTEAMRCLALVIIPVFLSRYSPGCNVKISESPHENRAFHGWSDCNGNCPVIVYT